MKLSEQHRRELRELILATTAGDATDAQRDRLSKLVCDDSELALYAVQLLQQEAWLGKRYSNESLENLAAVWPQCMAAIAEIADTGVSPIPPSAQADKTSSQVAGSRAAHRNFNGWLIAASLLLVGGIVGSLATRWVYPSAHPSAIAHGDGDSPASSDDQPYLARFVQSTACVWEPGHRPLVTGSQGLRAGESFSLMEGIAQIELDLADAGTTALTMEGPARMILTAEGSPSLSKGKFMARVERSARSKGGYIEYEMPFGQIRVAGESSFGVAVQGLEVEVHVFAGEVVVVCPWLSERGKFDQLHVDAGDSLRVFAEKEATKVERGIAEPAYFATQTNMGDDRLEVTGDYVSTVKQAAPFVYWRFETDADGIVRNEMSDRYNALLRGKPGWSTQGRNRAIEFGTGDPTEAMHAYVKLAEPLQDEIRDSYSIEFWVKPSHFHLGSLVSVYRSATDPAMHGILLELGGTLATPSEIEHAGKIRFLHRNRPDGASGWDTSCFSEINYELRRWAHIVAVKDGAAMRLYVNAQLVGSATDDTNLATGLTMAIGQLDERRHHRTFIGQFDELAIYNRALGDDEILQHYELVRPRLPSSSLHSSKSI